MYVKGYWKDAIRTTVVIMSLWTKLLKKMWIIRIEVFTLVGTR